MAKNDFSKLKSMLELSSGFSLSEQQYEKIIGRKMPKSSKYYLAKKSALAEFAKEMGFAVVVHEEKITTISFVKI